MDWNQIYLDTFIPELPKFWNGNFEIFKRYLDVFYDESRKILIKPVETTGKVKGANGEFVTMVVDNLVVKNQFTNLYSNITTADADFANTFIGQDSSIRIASSDTSTNVIWPLEPSAYSWIDVNKPYFKINNEVSIGFYSQNFGQEFQIIFDIDVSTTSPYTILMQSTSEGPVKHLSIAYDDASTGTWIKLIAIGYDASYGMTWAVKQFGGNYTII